MFSFHLSQASRDLVGQKLFFLEPVRLRKPERPLARPEARGRVRSMTRRATFEGFLMLRSEATAPAMWFGPCITAESSSTTPILVRQTAVSDARVVRIVFDDVHARNNAVQRIVPLPDDLHRVRDRARPFALAMATGCPAGEGARSSISALSALRVRTPAPSAAALRRKDRRVVDMGSPRD